MLILFFVFFIVTRIVSENEERDVMLIVVDKRGEVKRVELYIEYVILDNFSMNFVILKMLDKLLGVKIGWVNKSIICILGSIFAIFLPYLYFNKFLLFLYRIVVSIILVMSIRRFRSIMSFLQAYGLFILCTFVCGGVCYGMINLLGIEYTKSGILISDFEFPIGLFITIMLVVMGGVLRLLDLCKRKLYRANYIYKIILIDGEKRVESFGFCDTGNNVIFDSNGVNIISLDLFSRLHQDVDLTSVVLGKVADGDLRGVEYIPIAGLSQSKKYLSFLIDKMIVGEEEFSYPRIAVALKDFGEYGCILHRQFVRGEGYEKILG